jgi:hypothetical protein
VSGHDLPDAPDAGPVADPAADPAAPAAAPAADPAADPDAPAAPGTVADAVTGGWAARWQAVLDELGAGAAREVARGGALARRGAVDQLTIHTGEVAAIVAEDRLDRRTVTITWPPPDDAAWGRATAALAGQLRFTAALLEGDLPDDADEVLAAAGVPLLPTAADLGPSCDGEDCDGWCRHAVAAHVALATRIDREPAQLLRLRGRSAEELLRGLRAEPGETGPAAGSLKLLGAFDAANGDLDAIALHPMPVDDPASLFRHLGEPPGVSDDRAIAAIIERAAAGAWRLAAGDGAEAADEELLLAELRAQRVATAAALAGALGRDEEAVRNQLDELYERGAVLRTGAGDRARYRAAAS